MDTKFRPSDDVLEQLVADRRRDVERMQKKQADQLKDIEERGQAKLADLKKSLPKDIAQVLERLDKDHDDAAKATDKQLERVKAELVESSPSPEDETALHPGLAGGQLVAPSSVGWFSPYYGTLHWSDGTVVWQGYNPGNIDLWLSCSGSGSGIFGTGSCEGSLIMDWWFTFIAPANRYYGHTIWVPYHGFYIIRADDGFWDSKYASARIDLSAVGYQYNYKGTSTTNIFSMGNDNINVNDRIDGWRTMYYADLLGADRAYLRVSSTYHVYARGGGSASQLNFSDGNANYMGIPWVYVD
jgi:hypothetical protein